MIQNLLIFSFSIFDICYKFKIYSTFDQFECIHNSNFVKKKDVVKRLTRQFLFSLSNQMTIDLFAIGPRWMQLRRTKTNAASVSE
jgi:hypothetical protein